MRELVLIHQLDATYPLRLTWLQGANPADRRRQVVTPASSCPPPSAPLQLAPETSYAPQER
ncbi:hypothetical protein [Streptomyces sp. AC495_CC817]|uniref:hypothetical protein n=1 Tax=Streptomyces sp. AC495_CC817 TaxID=2823900 RepID=UPI001C26C312|nr:hypothetical protein [Streptomyces sp. AC495_CC817]